MVLKKLVINYQTCNAFLLNVCWLSRYHLDFVSFDVSVKHPGNGETIHIKSILSTEGIAMIMNDAVKNFSEFPALGLVLAVMIGVGLC